MGRGAARAKERAAAARRRAAAGDNAMFVAKPGQRQMGRSASKRRQEAAKKQKRTKLSASSLIEQVDITSNKDRSKTVSVVNGMINLKYYESLLQDHIAADITFVDAGSAIDGKTALAGLPINGEENVQLKFTDNQGNTLSFNNTDQNPFYVKKVTPIGDDTTKSSLNLKLITKEAIKNDKCGVEIRMDGKISDHAERILTDKEYLATQKELDIEETLNNLNYFWNKNKPYWCLNEMSKDAVPSGNSNPQAQNNSAGFIFYETSEGFHFKSIDGLLKQEKKLSVIYNGTPGEDGKDIPAGYDVKALEYSKDNSMDITKKLRFGAWNTKQVLFDWYNLDYEVSSFSAEEKEEFLEMAGKELPVFNEEFNSGELDKNFSKTTFVNLLPGVLPTGTGLGDDQQQLGEKSKQENGNVRATMNQSIMRRNQLFSSKVMITIAGNFSLHAGDAIWVDSKELKETKNKACADDVDKESGGKYIIATLCHYLTPKETYTKLVLIRDSVGRNVTDGNHVNRS